MNPWKIYNIFNNLLTSVGCIISGVVIILMTALITFEVIARSTLGFSTLIADEMSGYFLVALSFLGVAYAFKNNGFIRIDVLYLKIPNKLKKYTDYIIIFMSTLYVAIITIYFIWMCYQSFVYNVTSTYISRTPLFIPQLCMCIGGFMLLLQLISLLISQFIKRTRYCEGAIKE